ncbi:hypothetical protein ACIBVL_25840 [Streptomyces sp. NPDC049687]|uniref:hypothetical protein n=1 Tax=Streptomyces sp. NPDC049687 TaxID=3365596 RepID=UPI0037ADD907
MIESALAALGLPTPGLYLTIGAARSGKTRIATAFPRTWRLSLDDCRERVADDPVCRTAPRPRSPSSTRC